MAEWWNKLVQLGQKVLNKGFENPLHLEKELIEAIVKFIEPVAEVDPELCAGLLRYVIDGTNDEVLLKLGGSAEAAIRLGFRSLYNNANPARANLLKAERRAPTEVWIRLANVMASAMQATGQKLAAVPGWPDWLIMWMKETSHQFIQSDGAGKHPQTWTAADLEQLLAAGELPADVVVKALLLEPTKHAISYGYYFGKTAFVQAYADIGKHFEHQSQAVDEFLRQADGEQRVYALKLLCEMKFNATAIVGTLVDIATGSAKGAREIALQLLADQRETAVPLLEQKLRQGTAAERYEAVVALWQTCNNGCSETLRHHLAQEKADRVKQLIEKYLARVETTAEPIPQILELPKLDAPQKNLPLSEENKNSIRELLNKGFEGWKKFYEQQLKQWNAPDRPRWMQKPVQPQEINAAVFKQVISFIETGENMPSLSHDQAFRLVQGSGCAIGEWLVQPLELLHFVRLAFLMKLIHTHVYGGDTTIWIRDQGTFESFRNRCDRPFGLREFDAAFATLPQHKAGTVMQTYMRSNPRWSTFCDWEAEAIWPAFAEQIDLLRDALKPVAAGDYTNETKRENTFRILSMFPQIPGEFLPLLWDLALGEGKRDRIMAQAALKSVPDKATKVVAALEDGKQNVRAAAATWLGKIGDKSAIEPLKKTFAKEKSESAKGALMLALDALGASVDEFLKRDELQAEAKSGLSKKLPKGIEWVPLDQLPALHWQDTGEQVDPSIVRWWVVQSIQHKSPLCGPILRRYLSMCRKTEATALARFILSSWISRDTATMSLEEAAQKAEQESNRLWGLYGSQKYYQDIYGGSKDKLFDEWFNKFKNECAFSAIDQKGMLSIAAGAGDAQCVKMCDQYIRKWFGSRLAQSKALVDVLASIEDPLALQSLLSFANRFRTKAIKQLAEEHVQGIAERNGWTIDELADRTIPDAGFERPVDENGVPIGHRAVLELDYGTRQFDVTLNDDLEPVITPKGESKTIKNLPEPGKTDDVELAKAAKKELSEAKKAVKEVLKRQQERFYEALCTQRSWKFHEWQAYLAQHPIVGKLCVRLVWAAFTPAESLQDAKFIGCLRPLEDGSLTNEKDEEVKLSEDSLIALAHTCNTPEALATAWLKHLEDYDVTPLFQQFGRSVYKLPEEKSKSTEITDFEGHIIGAFKLRSKATKLGYVRGEAEDGGWFVEYRKPFSSLGIQAIIEFTGNCLPEEDRNTALINVHFTNIPAKGQSGYSLAHMPLGKVPPVLLSECYNDLKQLAAEGAGFDPKWKETSYY